MLMIDVQFLQKQLDLPKKYLVEYDNKYGCI